EVSLQRTCSSGSTAFSAAITITTTSATIRMGSDPSGLRQEPAGFKAFPNPSKGKITIETTFEGELLIVNGAGQEIKKMALSASRTEVEIQENGIYLLLVRDQAGNVFRERVVIQR
ncbi:MAG: T9SS type A sorting domain-containing protein, partial [Bacteroidota bacterium]